MRLKNNSVVKSSIVKLPDTVHSTRRDSIVEPLKTTLLQHIKDHLLLKHMLDVHTEINLLFLIPLFEFFFNIL